MGECLIQIDVSSPNGLKYSSETRGLWRWRLIWLILVSSHHSADICIQLSMQHNANLTGPWYRRGNCLHQRSTKGWTNWFWLRPVAKTRSYDARKLARRTNLLLFTHAHVPSQSNALHNQSRFVIRPLTAISIRKKHNGTQLPEQPSIGAMQINGMALGGGSSSSCSFFPPSVNQCNQQKRVLTQTSLRTALVASSLSVRMLW